MANLGVKVSVYENNVPAVGYTIGFEANEIPAGFFPGRDRYASVSSSAVQQFDSGNPLIVGQDTFQSTRVWVQTPGRDPLTVEPFMGFYGPNGDKLQCNWPFFKSLVADNGFYSAPAFTVDDEVKLWFVKVKLKQEWMNATRPLKERWTGGGGEEWTGGYLFAGGGVQSSIRDQTFWVPGQDQYRGDWRFNTGIRDYLLHGYTDENGEIEYRFLAAWAIGRAAGYYSLQEWDFYRPDFYPYTEGPAATGSVQDVSLFVQRRGRHPRPGWTNDYEETASYAYPWAMRNSAPHKYSQAELGATVDYSTWDGAGGFTTPAPELVTHSYQQGVNAEVREIDGTPVSGVTVSFNGFSAVTGADGKCVVYGMPTGSTLKNKLKWLRDDVAAIGDMPVQDATPFIGKKIAVIKASTYGSTYNWFTDTQDPLLIDPRDDPGNGVNQEPGGTSNVTPAVAGAAFTIGAGGLEGILCGYSTNYFDGGEQVALKTMVRFTTTTGEFNSPDFASGDFNTGAGAGGFDPLDTDPDHFDVGSGRIQEVVIWEDYFTSVYVGNWDVGGATVRGDDLDWSSNPFAEPVSLTEAHADGIKDHRGEDMEKTFTSFPVINETLDRISSPSKAILPDHSHALAAIKDAQAKLFISAEGDGYAGVPITVAADVPYSSVCLREAPDGRLIALLVASSGGVFISISSDFGETWGAPVATGITGASGKRPDLRHNGDEWIMALPTGSGITAYVSRDESNWASLGTIVAVDSAPLLLILTDGNLLAAYNDGANIRAVLGERQTTLIEQLDDFSPDFDPADFGGGSGGGVEEEITWQPSVLVRSGVPPTSGPAGFANSQKVLIGTRTTETTISYSVSYDGGDAWEEGSEG